MKTKTILILAAIGLLPLAGFAQTNATPPIPPTPAAPPVPPNPRALRERAPKVPVTFLGVETSEVPSVVAEQLGLAKGFGLVVDYVVPDGPAAAAGVQPNDILKMFNDQILTEPNQLSKLVRSSAEGAAVTLTVLRKGAETKLNAKLGKHEVTQRRGMDEMDRHFRHGEGFGDLGQEMENFGDEIRDQVGEMQLGMNGEDAQRIREQVRRAVEEGRRAAREGQRAAAESMRQAAREMRVVSRDNGAMKTTRIDLGKAQIVYRDDKGEMKIENVDNKKMLTAKDPQGRLIFSGPIWTKEELDKVPAEVRQRYEKLEQKDLPAVAPKSATESNESIDNDNDDDHDAAESDEDSDNGGADVLQVTGQRPPARSFPSHRLGINTVLI